MNAGNAEAAIPADYCVNFLEPALSTTEPTNDSRFPHERQIKRPGWLPSAHRAFSQSEERLKIARRAHAIVAGTLVATAMNLLFLYGHSPAHQEVWFSISVLLFVPSLLSAPVTWIARRYYFRKRNALARRFFNVGLAIDRHGRLVTHEAHAKVVLDHPRFEPDFPSAGAMVASNTK